MVSYEALKRLFKNFIKADTDNVKVTSEPAYDSTNDWKKVSVENDNVGLAKATDVSADQPRHITNAYDSTNDMFKVDAQQVANPPNLDIPISAMKDALKPARATPVQQLNSQSIDAGKTAEFTVSDTDGYSAVAVTVKATYDASATAGVMAKWLYSPDGTNYDSPEDAEAEDNYEELSIAAGETRQRTILVPLFTPYVKIQVVNLDNNAAVTVDAWTTMVR